jgi:hypothetical protein
MSNLDETSKQIANFLSTPDHDDDDDDEEEEVIASSCHIVLDKQGAVLGVFAYKEMAEGLVRRQGGGMVVDSTIYYTKS